MYMYYMYHHIIGIIMWMDTYLLTHVTFPSGKILGSGYWSEVFSTDRKQTLTQT